MIGPKNRTIGTLMLFKILAEFADALLTDSNEKELKHVSEDDGH